MTEPDPSPEPLTAAERAEDRRVLKVFVFWLCGCAAVAVLYLLLAIWLDWV